MSDVIHSSKTNLKRALLVWAIGMTFVLFQFTLQLSSGVLIEQVAISFKLSAFQAGSLSAMYYYIYVLLQIPAGILADRYGARIILSIGSFACGLGCFIFAFATSITMADTGRLIMGAGGSLSFVGVLFLVHHWFPANRYGMMIGVTETAGLLCTIAGSLYLADFVVHMGWRYTMQISGIISIVIATLCWLVVRDTPHAKSLSPSIMRHEFMLQLKALLSSATVWLNGIYCGLLYSVITVFVALWGIPFMSLKYDISLFTSTAVNVTLFAGTALACPLVGWAASEYRKHRLFLLIGAFGPAAVMTLVIYTTPPLWGMFVLMFLCGVTISPYVLTFAKAESLAPESSRSTCIGLTNGLCMCTAPIFQMVVGKLLEVHHVNGDTTIVGHYLLSDYHFALSVFPIVLATAGIIAIFLKYQRISEPAPAFA